MNLGFPEEMPGSEDSGPEMAGFFRRSFSSEPGSGSANARAALVNRTHRVVRERAETMRARRKSARDLVVPLLICSALLLMVCYAVWTVVSNTFGFAAVGTEIEEEAGRLMSGQAMDSGGPVYLLLMWFLPVSLVTLATVLFRRSRGRANDEVTR